MNNKHDYMNAGITARMMETAQHGEQLPGTAGMQGDCGDTGGGAAQGAVAAVEQRREQLPTTAGMQEVEQRREQLPRASKASASVTAIAVAMQPSIQLGIKMVRYRLSVGCKHQITSEELKKVLIDESGVDKNNVRIISIQGDYTLLELPDEMPQDIFLHLKMVEIKQHKLDIKRVKVRSKKRGNNYNRRGRSRVA